LRIVFNSMLQCRGEQQGNGSIYQFHRSPFACLAIASCMLLVTWLHRSLPVRVKAPWRFQNQFNTIYWEVWTRLMSCVGDLLDVVDSCTDRVPVPDGIGRLMDASLRMSNGYVPGQVASNRWTFPDSEIPVMNENIISLFDQLCYVVVFGNISSMMERVPQTEREFFFINSSLGLAYINSSLGLVSIW
jgi:hypothetical protein